jgi:outer membrane protein OmpA-like peptidoglycan-associated protein
VKKAVASSVLLLDVMDVILNAKGTPENIALKIVNQNRALGILSKNVGALEKNLQTAKSDLTQTEGTLKRQNEKLKKSSTQVRFQEAMEEAGKHFSEDEASVYQQGNKLIFRLKKINFASGVSTVPNASKQLLAKVNDIITDLEAELVAVQGHTDSVGAADLNSKLSTKRANSVAIYLSSLAGGYKIGYIGYGESRPIASNETKEGRAINRRVDLVITAKK